LIGKILAHYEITGLLGKGGMGEVYRARDAKLGREVALKILPADIAADPVRLQRFQREARTVAGLNHPNIVTLYAVEEADGAPFLTMELVEGANLQQTLAKGKVALTETVAVGIAVAEALAAAHAKGVVHRDLKPANIVLDREGRVKVLDFGMAKMTDQSEPGELQATLDAALTMEGAILGTAPYMAPEQARGEAADHRADLWALGVVLYEMTTGARPFAGDNLPAVLHRINSVEPPAVTTFGAPAALGAIVARALAKDPGQRYQSAGAVVADLQMLAKSLSKGGGSAQAAAALPLLAVLPFSGLKPDPETDYLGFALADQVIGSLAYIKTLLIKPSSAVRKYQGQAVDQAAAARDLKVDYLLTGYYLKEAGTVRLNVELVRTANQEMVWRDAIQVRFDNVFELQDIVSEKVVHGLEIRFPQEGLGRTAAYVPANPAAYEFYLRSLSYPHTNEGDRLAIGMLRNSIELDGEFAAAHAELGTRLSSYGLLALQGPEIFHEIEACYRKALAKDSENLPALGGLAGLSAETGKIYEALELSERMLKVNPNHPRSHYVRHSVLRIGGLLDESWAAGQMALSLDPGNPGFRSLGFVCFYSQRYDDAIEMFNLDKDAFHNIAWVGFAKYLKGDKAEGLKMMEAGAASEPDGHLGHHFGALMAGWRGDFAEGMELARRWEAPGHYDAEWWYNLANTYAVLGDLAGCVRTLKRSVDGGFICYDYLARDPLMESMRSEPAVAALIEQARQKHLAFKEVYHAKFG
jgi:TolB-like protein/predicted Ser/Thr protein kinase